jgi:hypothetical protein
VTQRTPISPWRPIATAPKDGTQILLYAQTSSQTQKFRAIGVFDPGLGWVAQLPGKETTDLVQLSPTHWMPLPEFP